MITIMNTLTSDVDECEMYSVCNENARCRNTPGSYLCLCNDGYQGNGKICNGSHQSEFYMILATYAMCPF